LAVASHRSAVTLYCDTHTLLNNSTDEPAEREAVASLLAAHRKGVVVLYGSAVN
jgi:hypothetical protein